MIWLLGLVCMFTNVQCFLPSIAEIRARTRWCLGEGAHCPVNLYHGFSSCCKPYVCTVVPKTCKPNLLFRFTDYKDYRCLLPPGDLDTNLTKIDVPKSKVKSTLQENESIETAYESNGTYTSSSENETSSYSSNSTYDQEASEGQEGLEDKGNANEIISGEYNSSCSTEVSENNDYTDNKVVKNVVKRSILNNSSELVSGMSAESSLVSGISAESSLVSGISAESSLVSSNQSSAHNLSSYSTNETDSLVDSSEVQSNQTSEVSEESHILINLTETYDSAINGLVLKNHSEELNSVVEENRNLTSELFETNSSSIIKPNSTSVEMPIEDWHSSEMQYDTRPILQKVVTIPPLHVFHSVEVIKINESIETSA